MIIMQYLLRIIRMNQVNSLSNFSTKNALRMGFRPAFKVYKF